MHCYYSLVETKQKEGQVREQIISVIRKVASKKDDRYLYPIERLKTDKDAKEFLEEVLETFVSNEECVSLECLQSFESNLPSFLDYQFELADEYRSMYS